MVKSVLIAILCALVFLGSFAPAFAEFSFTTSSPQTISAEEILDLQINLSLQGQANKIYFLEGAFKKEGASNYFGQTETDLGWVNYTSSNFSQLKQITTDSSGKWSGSLRAKLDTSSSYFQGNGNYLFQLKRFTSSSGTWSDNSLTFTVSGVAQVVPSPSVASSPSSSVSQASSSKPQLAFNISQLPTSIKSTDLVTVNTELLNHDKNKLFYLKGSFRKEGSTNYFGKTMVGGSLVKASQSSLSQLSVQTNGEGRWNGNLSVQADSEDTGFVGSGSYLFKVGKYNSSGADLTWSNELPVYITFASQPSPVSSTSTKSSAAAPASSTSSNGSVLSAVKENLKAASSSSSISGFFKLPQLSSNSGAASSQAEFGNPFLTKDNQKINFWYIASVLVALGAIGLLVVYVVKNR